ncbi:type II toxin-antitoxin system prevent-host-death family antitoxin [Porticoccaceae bacterium]|nr:type II toxin-antitoxin system prevent-host-death family antitoxin [Porticoccaceae bacterium]
MKDEKISIIKRRSIRILSELHSSKAPTLITENDPICPDLAGIYDDELEQRRIRILKGIAKGECDIDEGRCFTHGEAKNKLNKWLE